MTEKIIDLRTAKPGDNCYGFELIKKEYVENYGAELYTMKHLKTGAELIYFDRNDENKTFSIAFKTLPEDNTGVFHILEHSLLSGSEKYPVKEPFVSLLQNSMQTFLNAMTFGDKTVFPVSSRNEQDLFNLMSVYLDGVFRPLIYKKPEIFMQEGWHYEFAPEEEMPYYNGVVYSEMKGAFADVDQVINDETMGMLFPDNSYGYTSGGKPENITDLTYDKFIATHKRFYHPSNARIFLDGHMDVNRFLKYMDEEYLSAYDYRENDFDFVLQTPKTGENIVYYAAQPGEEGFAHMSGAKILCDHRDVEKLYAAHILSDYLTGSNEAPLKRAFLEQGMAQDVAMSVADEMYQPSVSLVVYNTGADMFPEIKRLLPDIANELAEKGLDKDALMATLERQAFENREIVEPYGVNLAMKAYAGWLYGDDPLTHIDNSEVFENLRKKVDTGYFEELLKEIFGDPQSLSYLYVLPSLTKDEDDMGREQERLAAITGAWSGEERQKEYEAFARMQEWQQSMDSEEAMDMLPHLTLSDVPEKMAAPETGLTDIEGTKVLKVNAETNGIAYLNLYFDISDYTVEELQLLDSVIACFGELRTDNYTGDRIQTMIKAVLGGLSARIEMISNPGELKRVKPYFVISASCLKEKLYEAVELLEELLLRGRYDETDRIYETILQNDYMMKQMLIGNGHQFAITRALAPFSAENSLKELLEGESFIHWFGGFAEGYMAKAEEYNEAFGKIMAKAFAANRLFVGCSSNVDDDHISKLIKALPANDIGEAVTYPEYAAEESHIDIPGGVGFTALGNNLYALGGSFDGSFAVLSSLMSFGYLWNMIRVRGGAYGTGMNVQMNGNIFTYSYRDPDTENSRQVYSGMADFFKELLEQDMPLEEVIIGTLNMTDPLLSPAMVCDQECVRYLKGITGEKIAEIRSEIINTDNESLKELTELVASYVDKGSFCVVGSGK